MRNWKNPFKPLFQPVVKLVTDRFGWDALPQALISWLIVISLLVSGFVFFYWGAITTYISPRFVYLLISLAYFCTLVFIISCVLIFSMKWNIVTKICLSSAVEFSRAMEKIGIQGFEEQLKFVSRNGMDIYYAKSTITEDTITKACVKRVLNFSNTKMLLQYNDDKRLCLDSEQFESAYVAWQKKLSKEVAAITAQQEAQVEMLKTSLAQTTTERNALAQANKALQDKLQTQPAQEAGRTKRLREERLLWAVYIPVMDEMLCNAPNGKKFTTREIQESAIALWEQRTDLQEQMKQLTGASEARPSESFMDAVKAEFRERGLLSTGGRPKKVQ